MAKSNNYRVQLRRRREGKTDYQARKAMVISGRPRLVARASIKNTTAQIIIAKPIGDQVLAAANSRELIKKYGWKAPTGNLPAAYLTGLLCGLKAKAAGVNAAILDLGLINPTKGAKVFAILHGVIDAGVEIPHGDGKIVANRSKGDHIAGYAKELSSEEPEVYTEKFSKYTAEGVAPEKVTEHFSKTRAAIVGSFKGAEVAPEPESAPAAKPKPKAPTKPEAKPAPKPEVKPAPKPEAKPAAPKTEAKAAETPKAETKVEAPKAAEAPKAEAKVEQPKAAPKAAAKAPKEEAKPKEKAPAKEEAPKEKTPKAKAAPAKATASKTEKAPVKVAKAKAPTKEKAPKQKAASKEKASAKEKAPAKKAAAKKGEKKA
ncbi:MAG: 50S ribosomal protein L18 [Candidatus Bathyarchaeia archaeon]